VHPDAHGDLISSGRVKTGQHVHRALVPEVIHTWLYWTAKESAIYD